MYCTLRRIELASCAIMRWRRCCEGQFDEVKAVNVVLAPHVSCRRMVLWAKLGIGEDGESRKSLGCSEWRVCSCRLHMWEVPG